MSIQHRTFINKNCDKDVFGPLFDRNPYHLKVGTGEHAFFTDTLREVVGDLTLVYANINLFQYEDWTGQELYEYISAEIGEEDYKGAIIEFRSALQLDPRLSKAHYQLALAYIEVKDAVNAYRELEMASQVDPNNIDAITKAAEMLFQGNEIHESRKRLNKVFAKDPNNVKASEL